MPHLHKQHFIAHTAHVWAPTKSRHSWKPCSSVNGADAISVRSCELAGQPVLSGNATIRMFESLAIVISFLLGPKVKREDFQPDQACNFQHWRTFMLPCLDVWSTCYGLDPKALVCPGVRHMS